MLQDFKNFIMRGNVVDMAVGIIIGTAFTTIINSLVADVIMPPMGILLGSTDFSDLIIVIKEGAKAGPYATVAAAKEAGAVTINIGLFINSLISFFILASAMFFVIKGFNKVESLAVRHHSAPEATTKNCPFCYSVINIKATKCPNCTADL